MRCLSLNLYLSLFFPYALCAVRCLSLNLSLSLFFPMPYAVCL